MPAPAPVIRTLLPVNLSSIMNHLYQLGHKEYLVCRVCAQPSIKNPSPRMPLACITGNPEITVDGDTATGIWYLQDIFVELNHSVTIMGSALYDDAYRKESGEWKIARTGYRRLWEEYHPRGDDITLRLKPIPDEAT